jgi:hypothetical protein
MLEIHTQDQCNKALPTLFDGSFPKLKFLHIPMNCLASDSTIMLIKCVGEGLPQLEVLDLSYMLMQDKPGGTPSKKEKSNAYKLLQGISMKA